jgi:hypothetical protein
VPTRKRPSTDSNLEQITQGKGALTDGVKRRGEAASVERERGKHREGEEEQQHQPRPRPRHLSAWFSSMSLPGPWVPLSPSLQTFLHSWADEVDAGTSRLGEGGRRPGLLRGCTGCFLQRKTRTPSDARDI